MIGNKLAVDMHVVTTDGPPVRNLELCVNKCHLEVQTMVATPYAAGLSTLTDDEAELGVACVDMGGGTTSIAIFADNHFCHVDTIPVGGHHVTMDIARGLSTRLAEAERLKTLYGSALPSSVDEQELISVPSVGDDGHDTTQVPRGALTRIIRPRIEETLEIVRDRIAASGYQGRIGQRSWHVVVAPAQGTDDCDLLLEHKGKLHNTPLNELKGQSWIEAGEGQKKQVSATTASQLSRGGVRRRN
jgi:cell division protein FtsA